jgi:aminoglycoside phosphotransferase (APT) family kinase protein
MRGGGRDDKAAWTRPRPLPDLTLGEATRLLRLGLPGRDARAIVPLVGGLSNFNYLVHHDGPEPVVLRIYDRTPGACEKETDIHRLVGPTVPVPEILHAAPRGTEGCGPFVLMTFVGGISFRELKESGDERAIGEASASIGGTLAAIGAHLFPRSGRLLPGPTVGEAFEGGLDPVPRFVERCLESPGLVRRAGPALVDRVRDFVWSWSSRLEEIGADGRLVHGDFNSPNILVHQVGGRWTVAAVLDWEFALSGSPLFDLGNFLRYERGARPLREPAFSRAFQEAGGSLPDGWRALARVVDLTSLCEILTRDALPDDVVAEVLDLVRSTLEARDPD